MNIYSDITKTIGKTPLIKLQRLGQNLPGEVLLKLEFFNPFGSVKDRIGLSMIDAAEKSGELQSGYEIIEPTSGNTGIALAFVAAAKGYKLTLVMPDTMSHERRVLLLLLGCELILTPGPKGMKGAIAKTMQIREEKEKAGIKTFSPSQFKNPSNPEIHKLTTAEEIWKDTGGQVDIVVSGVGTGGTITGVGEILKQRNPSIKMVAVEPVESPVLSGGKPGPHKIQGIGPGFIPKNYNPKVVDSVEQVDSETSLKTAREVIKKEGIPVGISSGAAIAVGLRLAEKKENQGKKIVVIVPSNTERYLSSILAQEESEKAKALPTVEVSDEWLAKVT